MTLRLTTQNIFSLMFFIPKTPSIFFIGSSLLLGPKLLGPKTLNVPALSKLTNVSRSRIAYWRSGEGSPNLNTVKQITQVLNDQFEILGIMEIIRMNA